MLKRILVSVFCLFTIFSSLYISAQSTNVKIKTMYSYSFNAEMDKLSIEKIEQEVMALKNVTEAKVKYKEEKKSALLIVIVQEARRMKESDVLFQPTDLKKIITKNGYMPNVLKTKVLSK